MKQDEYMGLDVHQAMTVAVVLDAEGKVILETMVATEAAAILRLEQSLSGPLRVTFEETTQAEWLHEVLRRHVTEVVVCDPRRNKLLGEGSKGDKVDARKLADLLRTGMLRSVYHGHEATKKLKELVRAYESFLIDTQRTMARIKAIYRGRGIATPGRGVYQAKQREQWLEKLAEPGMRQRAAWLYEQLDHVRILRKKAKQTMLTESQAHRAVSLLRTIPQLEPIRATFIVATVDTPHRFRTKRQFWSYVGLAVVTHMSAEYEMKAGKVIRRQKPIATRGLAFACKTACDPRIESFVLVYRKKCLPFLLSLLRASQSLFNAGVRCIECPKSPAVDRRRTREVSQEFLDRRLSRATRVHDRAEHRAANRQNESL